MTVAADFLGFEPVAEIEPKAPVFSITESQAYNRAGRVIQAVVNDIRGDVDDSFGRLASLMVQNPDVTTPVPLGVAFVDGNIAVGSAANTVVFKGNYKAEADQASAVKAAVTIGTGNGALTFTARAPGNGSDDFPNGNRILIKLQDPVAINQSLGARTDVITLDGKRYRAITIDLATDGAGAITSTATLIAALSDVDLTKYVAVTAGGSGADVVTASVATQLEDGEGGVYAMFIPNTSGVWTQHWPTTWTDTAVTAVIDGTAYTGSDGVQVMILANGFASLCTAQVIPAVASHDLGGADHVADTLADLNTKVSDDTLLGVTSIQAYASGLAPVKCFRQTVTHANYTAVAQEEAFALSAFPTSVRIVAAHLQLVTAFSGGTVGAAALELGDVGVDNELITTTSVFTGVGAGLKVADGACVPFTYEAAYAPLLTCTVDGGKTVDLMTAGEVIVSIWYYPMALSA